MPQSIDPQPKEDEIECGRCGALIYEGLTRCPNCGVNLYEPDDQGDADSEQSARPVMARHAGILARLDRFIRKLTNRPYPADELFGAAIHQAELFNDLLREVGGDRPTVERLIEFERRQMPEGNRTRWLENAIRRWKRENRR